MTSKNHIKFVNILQMTGKCFRTATYRQDLSFANNSSIKLKTSMNNFFFFRVFFDQQLRSSRKASSDFQKCGNPGFDSKSGCFIIYSNFKKTKTTCPERNFRMNFHFHLHSKYVSIGNTAKHKFCRKFSFSRAHVKLEYNKVNWKLFVAADFKPSKM